MTVNTEQELRQYIGAQIASIRKDRNLFQTQLAEKISRSRVSVVNIEKGNQLPSIFLLWQIAQELEVPVERFFPPIESNKPLPTDILLQQAQQTEDINEDSKTILTQFLKDL